MGFSLKSTEETHADVGRTCRVGSGRPQSAKAAAPSRCERAWTAVSRKASLQVAPEPTLSCGGVSGPSLFPRRDELARLPPGLCPCFQRVLWSLRLEAEGLMFPTGRAERPLWVGVLVLDVLRHWEAVALPH